jgi:xanthine/CO dehydrogenase XdhC/CoxF family maturation factor
VPLIAEWPDVALPPLGIDHYTAFVALTHDPKIDDPALLHALRARLLLYRRARLAKRPTPSASSG